MKPNLARLAAASLWLVLLAAAFGGENLLVNGGFDDPDDPFDGWQYKYMEQGESWYFENHNRVQVIERDGLYKNVLKMHGDVGIFWGTGQGVKVDSKPIPFDPDAQYKLSLDLRSTGPGNRIYIIGYQWKPGIKPNRNPDLYELRKTYKGKIVCPWPNVGKYSRWTHVEGTFPGDDLSAAARSHLRRVKFISVHIVAIDCPINNTWKEGDLFVDNVVLEKVN